MKSKAVFGQLMAVLQTLPSPHTPPWTEATSKIYWLALEDVPDEDAPVLAKALVKTATFRPTPAEILERWRSLMQTQVETPAAVVASIKYKIARYGRHGKKTTIREVFPGWPHDGPVFVEGPPELTLAEGATVAAMGGWLELCSDTGPSGVLRGQLLKVAAQVLQGEQGETMKNLRLEYREQKRALELERPGEEVAATPPLARAGDLRPFKAVFVALDQKIGPVRRS